MSVQIIQQRLKFYNCQSVNEEQQAIREITQEIILAALGRTDFFKQALFQGGTCLRIFYGLNRFSEDLDFVLRQPDEGFQLQKQLSHISDELAAYGYQIEILDKNKTESTIRTAFLKDNSLGKILTLQHAHSTGPMAKISIKLEVDTNPPEASGMELKYLDFPFVSGVAVQDQPSLFAGKIHALLCRKYLKGRDWYDFIWYTSRNTGVNYKFLSSAINQQGPWENMNIEVSHQWLEAELENKICSIDWKNAVEDVHRFIRTNEQPSLEFWNTELFLGQLKKLS